MSEIATHIVFYTVYFTGLAICGLGSIYCVLWLFVKTVDKFTTCIDYCGVMWDYAINRKKFKSWLKDQAE